MMNSKARPKRKGFGYRLRKLGKRLARFRQTLAGFAVLCVAGTRGYSALVEGQFRQSGEVHRWMYDRVSLKNLLEDVGFIQVQRCAANESRIDHFSEYELDATSGRIRKPDSLFMEAMKPPAESAAVRSAA